MKAWIHCAFFSTVQASDGGCVGDCQYLKTTAYFSVVAFHIDPFMITVYSYSED